MIEIKLRKIIRVVRVTNVDIDRVVRVTSINRIDRVPGGVSCYIRVSVIRFLRLDSSVLELFGYCRCLAC